MSYLILALLTALSHLSSLVSIIYPVTQYTEVGQLELGIE